MNVRCKIFITPSHHFHCVVLPMLFLDSNNRAHFYHIHHPFCRHGQNN
nr:MAG TPA: hypothetical protein [Bacteriophage sp.]